MTAGVVAATLLASLVKPGDADPVSGRGPPPVRAAGLFSRRQLSLGAVDPPAAVVQLLYSFRESSAP